MKLKQYLNKHIVLYIIGIAILALGIRVIVDSDLGAAPWDLLTIGLFKKTGISIGSWQIVNNLLMIIATKVIFKKKWNFVCLIPGVLQGLLIDFYAPFIKTEYMDPYVALIFGCLLSAIGLTIYMNQGLSANAIDNFTFMIHSEKQVRMGTSKIISDSIPFIVIILLSIRIQIATILVYILVPVFMQGIQRVFTKRTKECVA